MGEEGVVAGDRKHRLPRLDPVAVVQRVHLELLPSVRAELQDGDCLVHAAEERALLLEDLHEDAGSRVLGEQRVPCVVEVRVGVVPGPHLLDRQLEHPGIEPLARPLAHSVSRVRQASRAAFATST
jgi:hypothetical protein